MEHHFSQTPPICWISKPSDFPFHRHPWIFPFTAGDHHSLDCHDRMLSTSGTKWSWWILFTAWCATTHASTGLSVVSNGRAEKPIGERVRTHKREVLTCKHVGAASKGEKFASFLLVASKQHGATGSLLLPAAPRDLTIRWHIFPWWTGMPYEVQLGRSSTFLNFQSWEASRINHF